MRALLLSALLAAAAGPVRAWNEEPTPELVEERDQLIDKITRGVDYDASVKRFIALLALRDQKVATSEAARKAEEAQREKERELAQARRKIMDEYHATLDHEVSWRCTLSPDPANPVPSREGRFKADWGKVIRTQKTRLPPKNALDEGEPITLYEIEGVARRYTVRGEKFGPKRGEDFVARPGDLVLVCNGGERSDDNLPPGWGPQIVRSGFAAPIARPPLISQKKRWNPIHVTDSAIFWIIRDVKWKYPDDGYLLVVITPDKDLGNGRWEVQANRDTPWILEAPAALGRKRELLKPGVPVWAILGQHRFDPALKRLILVAQDLEARYVFER
jgi:hypothetical protein